MAEFQEIIKQFRRMCWYYQRQVKCDGCPMAGCNISQCRKLAFDRPDETEIIVTKWAAEHPEPVYPTWGEWLQNIGVAEVGSGMLSIHPAIAEQPIPASFAQEHGIKPKEDA